jgi:hypothetical protein
MQQTTPPRQCLTCAVPGVRARGILGIQHDFNFLRPFGLGVGYDYSIWRGSKVTSFLTGSLGAQDRRGGMAQLG